MTPPQGIVSIRDRQQPQAVRQILPSAVMGTLLFVFTESMLFAGLISAHTVVRASGLPWPPPGQPRLPEIATLFNTAILLFSGGAMVIARLAWKRSHAEARTPLLVALLCGAAFVVLQGREWVALIAHGLTLTSSPYASFFYVIVGCHALHALAAILALGWAWRRMGENRLTPAQFGAVQVFWFFVVLVWPVIYFRVYL